VEGQDRHVPPDKNIYNPPREGNHHDEHRNVIKPAIVADYNHHMGHVDNRQDGQILQGQLLKMEVDKKALFPPVRHGHSQELQTFIFMSWGKNLTQRFSTHSYQRDAGTGWA
jgi:hypothetical protein